MKIVERAADNSIIIYRSNYAPIGMEYSADVLGAMLRNARGHLARFASLDSAMQAAGVERAMRQRNCARTTPIASV